MRGLRVYYGIRKNTKMIKKPSIFILFENGNNNHAKNMLFVNKSMHLCYTRFQNEGEENDAKQCTRMFTGYEMFFMDKPYFGDWRLTLEKNKIADHKNVSEDELNEIYTSLERKLKELFPLQETMKKTPQLKLELFD